MLRQRAYWILRDKINAAGKAAIVFDSGS